MKLQLKHIKTISTAPPSIHHMKKTRFYHDLLKLLQEERQLQRSWEQLQSGECGLPVMTSTQDRTGQVDGRKFSMK
jgi:hypothetical protein